ncbi:MAG: endo-1,4-beta-xylanase [Lachnospiraceae bacterium]|nr:endo-1,4-beta-xylanase [Lachnospiraceae bacterium]
MHKIGFLKKYMALGLMAAMCMSGCASGSGGSNPESAGNGSEQNLTSDGSTDSNNTIESSETEKPLDKDESIDTLADEAAVPVLRDSMEEEMGVFAGCAVTGGEVDDPKVWEIVTTHFSAVTLGNELKPDALVGYSVGKCPGTQTDELNGETITVPKLDYSRAEKILDKILEWNGQNPEKKIKVRGHVLVWHSQTPEWFFHEDYDKSKPYVSAAEMDKRLEWYIRTVLTHFTGEDSKYKDLFYGWDVVNEAISDGTGTYRSDNENPNESLSEDRHGSNSSWYHVYGNGDFIINAFKYANKYAPEDLELYYNDYNECSFNKKKGILSLLEEIKAAEGAPGEGTRISAMGMQGHYGMDSPSSGDIISSIQDYAKVVGKVQITELDISASDEYDGSDEAKTEENEKLRKRYNMIKYSVNSSNIEGDVVTGITFWGTVDHYSWLQSRSNVGGGNTTGLPQMPLLFDENYEPKPCFYVFAGKK